jgi:DNA-binding CsgD family transcriptional regulator
LARKVKLTPREVEILGQLCLGHSAEDIARNLSIRPRTVKFHQENLLRKTGASSRVELFRKLM